jgi:APA family basic amino acid/polyamine antiporter
VLVKGQMGDSWRAKPADKFVRPRRIRPFRLRRVLGIPGLFSIGYGDVGSSIYYALGVTAMVALGAAPIALGVAGLVYVFNALTYAEGSAMIPRAGGSSNFSRLAFNDLFGFVSGWALMLTYVVTVAIAAYTIPPYLSYFWPVLSQPVAGTLASMGLVIFLMVINVTGVGEWSGLNILLVTVDIIMQLTLIVLGVLLIFMPNPGILFKHMFGPGNWPTAGNLVFGIAIAALCFTGVESVAQHSEETRRPERKMRQTYILMVLTVLVLFAGTSLVALTAMTPQELGDPELGWARSPVAGIARAVAAAVVPETIAGGIQSASARDFVIRLVAGFRDVLPGLVGVLAAGILLMATNTGILGMARLTYSLSKQRQLPATLSRVHHRFRTPYVAVILFCAVAVMVLVPGFLGGGFFANLAALYVFGSLIVFASAHASILRLRVVRPAMARPFRLAGNIRVKGHEFPITAILGLLFTSIIWWIVVVVQPYSWWIGVAWLGAGLLGYYLYRKSQGLPLRRAPPAPGEEEAGGE